MLHKSLRGATIAVCLAAHAAAPAGQGLTVLAIDPGESQVTILVGKAGMLSFAGHAHEVVAPAVQGRVAFDPADWLHASLSLEFDARALRVTGKGEAAADVPTVEKTMLGAQVLDVERFPTIAFRSRRVSVALGAAGTAAVTIDGDMTLHGKTRPLTVRSTATVDGSGLVTATGTFTLKQTDFDMVPVTAAGGTIRVKDDVDIRFVLKARPAHDAERTGLASNLLSGGKQQPHRAPRAPGGYAMNARLAPVVGGLVLAAIALGGCGSGGSYANPMSPSPAPSPAPGPAPAAATLTIGIVAMNGDKSFGPNPSSVAAGQTVAFYNGDSVVHRVAANGGTFDTGNLGPGATSAPFLMPTAGAFAYHCTLHPEMVGTLNVTGS